MQVRFVKKVLGNKSPANLAAELVDGTGLADVKLRRRLLDADEAAIATATDPMISSWASSLESLGGRRALCNKRPRGGVWLSAFYGSPIGGICAGSIRPW
jgi:peptidase S46-like protein